MRAHKACTTRVMAATGAISPTAQLLTADNALRRVSLETQHIFGAVGGAEEHSSATFQARAPGYDRAWWNARCEAAAATYLLDRGGAPLPQYRFPVRPATSCASRCGGGSIRDVRETGRPRSTNSHSKSVSSTLTFARDIGETGWIGLGWPKEFGGQARSPLEQIAFMETMEQGEAPRIGASMQANAP